MFAELIGVMEDEDDTWAHASPLNRVITAIRIEIHASRRINEQELDAPGISQVAST
jgi:hypothetical protein